MHAAPKPPVPLASLVSVNKSPSSLAIYACIGNRQFDWRVPLGRGSVLQGKVVQLCRLSAFAGAGVGQGNHHSYGRVSLNWSCQQYWRVRRGRCQLHW